jgi:hypothetical protein
VIWNKVAKGFGIICKASKFLKNDTLITLYHCFVLPYLTYGIENWGSAAGIYLDPIVKLQKRIVRKISMSGFRDNTAPLFKQLKLLPLNKLYVYHVLIFMFKVHHKMLPVVFQNMFNLFTDFHNYHTRYTIQYHLPIMRLSLTQKNIRFMGPKLWNTYSDLIDFKKLKSLNSFKRKVKVFILINDMPHL